MKIRFCIKLFYFSLLIIGTSATISAQNSGNYRYNEDDYDGEYEYNNSYYERYSEDEYRKRQEKAYKKSYSEEELYNGGYRRKTGGSYENQNSYGGGINLGGFSSSSKSSSNSWFGSNNSESTPTKPRNIQQFDTREVGDIRGIDKLGGNGDGVVDRNFNPIDGKETDPKQRKEEGIPPPPDEPDIPVDTAIPYLIAVGFILAALKITKFKKALV